jgi:hypothetical protein
MVGATTSAAAAAGAAARPRILVTNDDGIDAPGLRELVLALEPLGEVYVCCPSGEFLRFLSWGEQKKRAPPRPRAPPP